MNSRFNRYGRPKACLPERDGSWVRLHVAPTGLAAVCRFMLDHYAWPSEQREFNAAYRAIAAGLTGGASWA